MDFLFSGYRKRVLMTGFTPFEYDVINPSWEGVKCLDGREIENKYDITLFRKEIGVIYKEVDTIVPQMLHYYQPHLTIHVGLNKAVQSFVLEKTTRKNGYNNLDNDEKHPKGYHNACQGPKIASTTLDVDRICRKFNTCKRKLRDPTLRAVSSEIDDNEEYPPFLCEYIYYTSLCLGQSSRSPTLFVHVPFDKYTSQQLAYGLERILELCLKQLSDADDYNRYETVN